MVKLYFTEIKKDNEKDKKYIDVSIWSLLKGYVLSTFLLYAIVFGALFLLGIIGSVL